MTRKEKEIQEKIKAMKQGEKKRFWGSKELRRRLKKFGRRS